MKTTTLILTAALALGAAACQDREDDVVQAPAAGQAPAPVTEARAEQATAAAAFAYGMTRDQLENADVLSRDNTDLGDVERLVLDPQGQLQDVVVELEGPSDIEVVVPKDQLSSLAQDDGRYVDLVTELTAEQLAALPRYTPAR